MRSVEWEVIGGVRITSHRCAVDAHISKGGQPPLDPKSDLPENQTAAMTRFKQDAAAQKALANTLKLADMKSDGHDTVFYPGGHGPMWDLAESPESIALLESFYNSDKPIALVCHSPGCFVTLHTRVRRL